MSAELVPIVELAVAADPGLALDDLAETIRAEYAAMRLDAASFLDHCVRCGEALLAARESIGLRTGHDGEGWSVWLDEKTDLSFAQASSLMRLAVHRHRLPPEAFQPYTDARGSLQQPSLTRAFQYLRGLSLPTISDSNYGRRIPEETRREATRLYQQGVDKRDVAELLGISLGSVYNICVPGRAKRVQNSAKQKRRAEARARRALAEEQLHRDRKAAAAERGDAFGRAYSAIRVAADQMQGLLDVEKDPETRRSLDSCLGSLHRAEDKFGVVLRIPRDSTRYPGIQRLAGEGPPPA